jgi:hypothetical protein
LKKSNKVYFVVFFAAIILAYFQTIRTDAPNYELKLARHITIIENTIEYPYKYRLLNPYITNIWFSGFKLFLAEKGAFLLAYFVQNILVFGFLMLTAFKFFRLWFDDTGAVASLLLFALIIPLSLTGYDVLGDMTTAAIMALGFYFINTEKEKFLYPLIFIGAFNELQVILLVPFYLLTKKSNLTALPAWINSAGYIVTFAAAYAVIYFIRGGSAGGGDVQWYFTKDAAFNIANKDWIILWTIMIAPLLLFVIKGFRLKPEFLKRSAMIVLPLFYFAAFFFIARMREIDKALTIFLILIPLALYSIIPNHIRENHIKERSGG